MKTITIELLKIMALLPVTLCDVNRLFVWPLLFPVQRYYLEQKWVYLALLNSGNFGVVVWGSQQFCTPSWQNFIRGLMQLKYFGFKWSRKTHSRWVVKSGRALCVHLWRMGVCVCRCVCLWAVLCRLYLSITCDCMTQKASYPADFRYSSKRLICYAVIIFLQWLKIEIFRREWNHRQD